MKLWYDAEGDYMEVLFDDRTPGYFRETTDERVMKKVRYRQILWIGFSGHAATFSSVPSTSSPFVNSAPALTNATR